MDIKQSNSRDLLGEEGPFASKLESYVVRAAQLEMAGAIEESIQNKQTLIAESGTGTGKTFAYLVPSLISAKKTLISTGTKHLQEQLFHRDIPMVTKVLELSVRIAILKGRSNYLCLHRMMLARGSARGMTKDMHAELEIITKWAASSSSGDIGDLVDVSEDSRIWPNVTSTVDNCIGQNCSFFEDCYVNKARKEALAADVVVINHHLFFADKSLKEDGFGALLPEADSIIFDEAHQIPDIASNFLGASFSSWQVNELCVDTRNAELKEKSLVSNLAPLADEVEKLVADTRLALGLSERRVSWDELSHELPNLPKKLAALSNKLYELSEALEKAAVAGEALTRCYERCNELVDLSRNIMSESDEQSQIRWVEIARKSFRIHETPLNIGDELSTYFGGGNQARIFTSATISVGGEFAHYQQLMGLSSSVESKTWPSPFDYAKQSILYVPEGLPEPKSEGFSEALFDQILPVITASKGATFVLFTSFRIMQDVYDRLEDSEFEVLMQGDTSKRELLREFVAKPNAVLLGTMSFWEGVDVPGKALRCVIIDKLPFESPFDPVIKARLRHLQDQGENPFMSYQVPRAVITLRQGAGRLIRSQSDKGVLMICDSRLRTTHYGRVFLDSLPPMARTQHQNKILQSLSNLAQSSEESFTPIISE